LGDRKAVVVRELTKLHEEIVQGKLSELIEKFSNQTTKGEIVLIIARVNIEDFNNQISESRTISDRVSELESGGIDHKTALKSAAKEFGLSKSEAYKILVSEKQ
jgi:16S rRNA (cytidine1402-2'-O)-methyltransferase